MYWKWSMDFCIFQVDHLSQEQETHMKKCMVFVKIHISMYGDLF
jgi:hypothetical protein